MIIRERLIALKTKIRQHFPKVDSSQSDNKIQAIQIMQELLAEVLLQIERVLEQKPLPKRFKDGSNEQKKVLTNLAQFCMAISLTGKKRIVDYISRGNLLDQKSYDSLNSILKNIYAAIDYLDLRIKPLDDVFEKGSSMQFPCHDLKMNIYRSFKSSLAIRVVGDEIYFSEIQEIIKELDNNYQDDNSNLAGSQPPPYSFAKINPTPSSNDKFALQTDSFFAGKFIAAGADKKTKISNANLSLSDSPKDTVEESLEKPSKPIRCSSSSSSTNGSTKDTVSFIIIKNGGLFSMQRQLSFRIKKEGSQPFTGAFFPQEHTLKEQYSTPSTVIFTKRAS